MKQEIYDLPVKYAVLELKELGGWLENYNNVTRGFIVSKCYLKKSSIEYFGYGMKEEKYDVIFPFTDFLEFKTSLKKYNYNTKEPLYCNPTYQLVTVEKVFDNYEKAKELAESKNHQLILSLNLLSLKDSKESQNLDREKGLLSHNLSIGQYFEQIISQNTVNMSLYNYHEGQSLVRCVKNDSME
ncbi:MAG: hypothetical protein HFI08_03605 [Bacilli bacterium]|jgi:hypothetical protein|nr:hypothetical protein [Bacilli bacterium]